MTFSESAITVARGVETLTGTVTGLLGGEPGVTDLTVAVGGQDAVVLHLYPLSDTVMLGVAENEDDYAILYRGGRPVWLSH